jgi:acyl dehydratase
MTDYYFEDFKAGQNFVSGGTTITEAQIIDYALKYDPQPFHLDVEAAKETIFGGLIASGWLTNALSFRLWYDMGLMKASSLGSPGIEQVRWLKPVRPGDTIHTEIEILDTRASRSKPDRGIVTMLYTVKNQHGETVSDYRSMQLIALRHPGAETVVA